MPNVGLLDNHDARTLDIRNYIWQVSGYIQDEGPTRSKNLHHGLKAKKYALVNIYKLWSAFTKGLRHTFNMKKKPIFVPKIGTFYEELGGHQTDNVMKFVPSGELSSALNCAFEPEQVHTVVRNCANPIRLNWQVIATAAGF